MAESGDAVKVLVVSPTPTHPQDAGNRQRIFALLHRLRQYGHELHLCFIAREAVDEAHLRQMQQDWGQLTVLPYDRSEERKSLGAVFGIDDWFPASLVAGIERLAALERPDVVIAEYVFCSRALDCFDDTVLKVIDTHDVFSDRHLRLQELGLTPGFFFTTRAEEARGLDRADLVLAIQDEEAATLQAMTRAAVVTLGHLPPGIAPAPPQGEDARSIGYIGSPNPLNARAIGRCIEAMDPGRLAAADLRLRIAGGIPAEVGRDAPFVERIGRVERLNEFYGSLALAINPHEGGTGLKIKTIEALAHGVPVMGTGDAFLGLDAEEVFHAAASPAELAGFVMRFAEQPEFRLRVAEASRRVFERYRRRVEAQCAMFRDLDALRVRARRPRMLLVTDIAFWQECLGNQARIAGLIRGLRGEADIDLFMLRSLSAAEKAAAQQVLGARGRVFVHSAYPGAHRTQPSWIESSPSLSGFERRSFHRGAFTALEEHLQKHRYSGLLLEYLRLSYLRHARRAPALRIIDLHDIMSMRVEAFSRFGKKHFIQVSAREELGILSGFSLSLAIQAHEYRYLHALFPNAVLHLPHAIPSVARRRVRAEPLRVVFVGGDNPMNRDGLAWFLAQVWPCLGRHGAELHVAGAVCNALANAGPDVVRHGRVDDLPAFLSAADIAVNPVYYGGGLKIKTVEYLCYGIPSVLTLEAVFGIDDGEGEAYLLARSRAGFVEHLDRLLHDPELRSSISERAFTFGRRHFAGAAMRPGIATMAAMLRAVPGTEASCPAPRLRLPAPIGHTRGARLAPETLR